MRRVGGLAFLPLAMLVACSNGNGSEETAAGPDLAFADVRVFDGERTIDRATVVVDGGEIVAISVGGEVPEGTRDVVGGRGRTLLPGLIDAHTHVSDRGALEQSLSFGVTTSLDMFTREPFAAQMREEQERGDADDRADLRSAGTLATARGGHGTQFGLTIPTLDGPEDAEGFVADRVAAGADYVKVVLEGGVPEIGARPTLDTATVRAVVDAAHGRDLLVIAHVGDRNDGRTAIEAGVDGLAHLFSDAPPDAALVDLAARSGVFVVPTTPVTETFAPDGPTENPVLADERLARCLSVAERRRLAEPARRFPSFSLGIEQEGIRRFHEAGVPIVAGSDAPNPGTAHGASLHREVELLSRPASTRPRP